MRVAINGLGRIGRQTLRRLRQAPGLEVVGLNDVADPACLAHLVKHDSVHGPMDGAVAWADGNLELDGRRIPLFREEDPARVPFGDLGAQVVLECTGRCTARERAARHLHGGVAHVVVAAPAPDADLTVVMGVNDQRLAAGAPPVLSAGCASSHAFAAMLQVLDRTFGVEAGMGLAVESYGNDQRILDLPHPDLRMARAAALSMIPAPSGAAGCLGQVIPHLAGKLEVQAVRVPTPDVSLADLCVTLREPADAGAILAAFRAAVRKGYLEVAEEQLVSVDLRGGAASCVLDPFLTRVMTPRFVKVFGWYDNEIAYAARLVDLCARLEGGRS